MPVAVQATGFLISMLKVLKNEDWLAFASGLFIILLALIGLTTASPKFNWSDIAGLGSLFTDSTNWVGILFLFLLVLGLGFATIFLSIKKPAHVIASVALLFTLSIVSQWLAGYKPVKNWGIEYVIFALVLGILIRNLFGLPQWLAQNLHTEFFIKTGLVLLGTSIIFQDVIKAGVLGLVQALVVVIVVWYFAFWIAKLLKIDEELSLMLSSAVSICGVSAAIATAGAIQGDSKKLSYVVSLVLIVALPMMAFMPLIAKALELSGSVAGAWLGGTIDTTGAVVASGTLLGEEALKYSTIVKFSQNVLLGFAAIGISAFWTLKSKKENSENQKISTIVIWERFPKFVLGFIGASLLYSFVIPTDVAAPSKDFLKTIQTTLFAIAFVSTGLETDFSVLVKTGNGKPALAFVIAQVFNVLFTLLVSYLLFG